MDYNAATDYAGSFLTTPQAKKVNEVNTVVNTTVSPQQYVDLRTDNENSGQAASFTNQCNDFSLNIDSFNLGNDNDLSKDIKEVKKQNESILGNFGILCFYIKRVSLFTKIKFCVNFL